MRLFSTATALVVGAAMTSSQCAAQAQAAEQATTNRFSRAEPQHESLLERNLSDKKTPRRQEGSLSRRTLKFLLEEAQTYDNQKIIRSEEYNIPPEENNHDKDEARELQEGQQQPICNICGEGKTVGNPDATAPVPGGQIPCDILQNMGIVGLIPSAQCDVLTLLIGTVCECEATNPTTTTTTTGATNAPVITTEVTSANSTIIVTEKSGKAGKSTSSSAKASKSTYYSGNSTSLDFNSTTTLTTTEGDDFNSTSLIIEEDTHNNSTSSKLGKSSSSAKSSKSIHGNSTSLFEVDYRNSTTLFEGDDLNSTLLIDEVDSLFS